MRKRSKRAKLPKLLKEVYFSRNRVKALEEKLSKLTKERENNGKNKNTT